MKCACIAPQNTASHSEGENSSSHKIFKEITEKRRTTEFVIRTSKGITPLEFKIRCNESHLFLPLTHYTLLGLADLLCEDNELSCMHITVGVADVQVRGFEVWTDDCTM